MSLLLLRHINILFLMDLRESTNKGRHFLSWCKIVWYQNMSSLVCCHLSCWPKSRFLQFFFHELKKRHWRAILNQNHLHYSSKCLILLTQQEKTNSLWALMSFIFSSTINKKKLDPITFKHLHSLITSEQDDYENKADSIFFIFLLFYFFFNLRKFWGWAKE